MSEEMKCPCCGSDIYVAVSENTGASLRMCLKCELVCPLVCLPLIAAAMELAKLEVEFENCKPKEEHQYQEMIGWARKRVLEVFK